MSLLALRLLQFVDEICEAVPCPSECIDPIQFRAVVRVRPNSTDRPLFRLRAGYLVFLSA